MFSNVLLRELTKSIVERRWIYRKGQKMMREARSDKGHYRLTDRDIFLLRWMGEMYGVRFDHLRILAGRYSHRGTRNQKNIMSEKGTYRLLTRWRQAGIAESNYLIAAHPQWVFPTQNGLELADLNYPFWKADEGAQLKHKHAINGVRLFLEEQSLKGDYMPFNRVPWISDRQVNMERKLRGRRHIVDGELLVKGQTIAIEVELTAKSQVRLKSIVKELAEDYPAGVWYFVSEEARPAIETAVSKAGTKSNLFKIYPLPEYVDYATGGLS